MRSASPWRPARRTGPRWKAAVRCSWAASAWVAWVSPAAASSSTPRPRAPRSNRSVPPVSKPLRVACIGMGWWSDVLADAMVRSGKLAIAACYSRSEEKRAKFAAKYGCRAVASYEEILDDPAIEAIVNTTPNSAHLETTRAAAAAGKHVFLDKPIANTVADARAITQACRAAGVVLAIGYQRRRESQ